MFHRLCVIGVGLIGGSIAKAAREKQLVNEIVAWGRDSDLINLKQAKVLNVIDDYDLNLTQATHQADLIVIAVPVNAIEAIFEQLKPLWSMDCLYFDVGSTKGNVVASAQKVFETIPSNFIPAHPIAGAEKSGVTAAQTNLFLDKRFIITPLPNTNTQQLEKLTQFWQQIGSMVVCMNVHQHDEILAATSHLPHLLAFALMRMLGQRHESDDIFKYAAGGFRDFTRIASSDPLMWQAICQANKASILPLIEQFKQQLTDIEQQLIENQSKSLIHLFEKANQARAIFLEQQS